MTAPFRLSSILSDLESLVAVGIVPKTVASFSELHDYIDANCLGGLCDDEVYEALVSQFGGRDENEGAPQKAIDLINKYQNAIDLLIKSGFFQE